jgi:hypothetical protein
MTTCTECLVPPWHTGTLELRVTAGTAAIGPLRQNTASFPVNPACAASSCPRSASDAGSSSTPAATPATSSAVTATQGGSAQSSQQESSATPTSAAQGSASSSSSSPQNKAISGSIPASTDDLASSTVGMLAESGAAQYACPSSSLGYQCSKKVADGVTIHYSYGGKGQPGNSCTQGATVDSTMGNDTSMMHFAIESSQAVRPAAVWLLHVPLYVTMAACCSLALPVSCS